MIEALTENVNTAAGLATLLKTLTGTTTTISGGGGANTKQTMINPADIMKQLLEASGSAGFGTSGLASTVAQGKRAGVYGGKSTELNINDLLSRVGTEAAIRGAPTVTTTPNQTTTQKGALSSLSGGNLALMLGAGLAMNKDARKQVKDWWDELSSNGSNSELSSAWEDIPAPLRGISPDDYNFTNGITSGSMDYVSPTAVDTSSSGSMNPWDVGGSGFGAVAGSVDYANMVGSQGGDAIGALLATNAENWGIDIAPDMAAQYADFGSSAVDAIDAGSAGADAASGAMGGFPILGTINALSDGNITSQEVGSVGGGWAGAQAGMMVGGPVGAVIGGVLGSVTGGSVCFITTAILKALGNHNDNAKELQILRQFRDTWLLTNHPEDIQEYYRIAPQVVEAIESRDDSFQVWRHLWRAYLEDAITMVTQGKNELAYHTYKEMVESAKQFIQLEEVA